MALAGILSSKLCPAPIKRGIARRRLSDRLIGANSPPLVLLHAIAGYGKTFLMTQAFEECHKRGLLAAWISLDRTESSAAQLIDYLYASFALATRDDAAHRSVAEPSVAEFLIRVERLGRPFCIFLDDYHHCNGGETDAAVAYLVTRAPANLRIVIATRERPQFGLTTLEVRQRVVSIDPAALAFEEHEFAALNGANLLPDGVERFLRKAEGWPAMLAIALTHPGLVLGQGGTAGTIPPVAEYLEQEVLAAVPAPWRTVLVKTSILEELTPELVALLADLHEGWTVLEELSTQRRILRRIGSEGEVYRLHPFLREHLQMRLLRGDPASAPPLHARAAEYYIDHGDEVAAARHAIQSGDPAVIQRLLGHTSVLRLAFKGGSGLLRMLKSVDPAVAHLLPHLSFAEIYLTLLANQPARAAESFRRIQRETTPLTGFMETDALVVEALIDAYMDDFSIEKASAIERKLLGMPAADDILLAVVRQLKLWAEYWNGDFVRPERIAHILRFDPTRRGIGFVQSYTHLALGMSALERGELGESEAHYRNSIDLAIRVEGLRASQANTARLLLAEVAYERNQLERSRNLLEGILDDVELNNSWFDIYASGYLTGSMLACADSFESAMAVLDRAQATASAIGLDRLRTLCITQRLKLAVTANQLELAGEQYALLDRACDFDGEVRHVDALGWRTTVPALMAAARYHLLLGDPTLALRRIDQILPRLERHRQNRRILEARLLRGIAHYRLASFDEMAADIGKALDIASQTGMERIIIDLGEWLVEPFDWVLRRPAARIGETELARRLRPLLEPAFGPKTNRNGAPSASPRLSGREYEVLLAIATGKTYKEVASELRLSINTVMTHRKKLYGRLDCNSRSRALSRARSLGLIP